MTLAPLLLVVTEAVPRLPINMKSLYNLYCKVGATLLVKILDL